MHWVINWVQIVQYSATCTNIFIMYLTDHIALYVGSTAGSVRAYVTIGMGIISVIFNGMTVLVM